LFSGTLNGGFDLTLTAGTGNITFAQAVGTTNRLGDVSVVSVNSLLADSPATFTVGSFTQSQGTTSTVFDGLLDLTGDFDFTASGTLTLNGVGDNTVNGFMEITNGGLFTTVVGANLLVTGNLTQNGAGLNSIGGDLTSTDGAISFDTAVTLTSDVTVTSGGGTGDDITFDSTIVSTDENQSLSLAAGALGLVSVNGAIGGNAGAGQALETLELISSNGAIFGVDGDDTISVRTTTSVIITGSRKAADIYFHGAIITQTLSAPTDPQRTDGITDPPGFEFNDEYNLYLFGDGTHVTNGTLLNTGILQFGDASSDSLIFENGITATGQSEIYLLGIPRTYGAPVILGDIDTTVFVYDGTSVIDTTFGPLGTSGENPDGANILIGGDLEGVSGAGGENITFIAGNDGDVTVAGTAGGLPAGSERLGIVTVQSANDVTLNRVTAQRLIQTWGTGTTTLNGVIDTNTGASFSIVNYFASSPTATPSGTRTVSLGVNLTSTHIVLNNNIQTSGGGVLLLASIGGADVGSSPIPNIGVVTLNNNGRISSDLDVILQGNDSAVGIQVNAFGTWQYSAVPGTDVMTGTQRDFVTTTNATVEFRSNIALVAAPTLLADRFIVTTTGTTSSSAPVLFHGTVDARACDLDIRSAASNVNFRSEVANIQRLFLRMNGTETAPAPTNTTATFVDNLTVDLLIPTAGHYNVDLLGDTILAQAYSEYYLPADNVFLNTGRVTFGNDNDDTLTAHYGIDTTASQQTVTAGQIVARFQIALSPVLLSPASTTTTISNTTNFRISVEADPTTQLSVDQAGGNTLVLGSTTQAAPYRFDGGVTVNQLDTLLSDRLWNLSILGALNVIGSADTVFENRGLLQLGSATPLVTYAHEFGGGVDTSTVSGLSLGGTLEANGTVTLTGGDLRLLKTLSNRITTNSGSINLSRTVLANGVDLTIGDTGASAAITTGEFLGTLGSSPSNVRFNTSGAVAVNGRIAVDIGQVEVINSGGASFSHLVGGSGVDAVTSITVTATTGTVTFTAGFNTGTLTVLGTANLQMPLGGRASALASITTTGSVAFGNGPNINRNPDDFAFLGGLTRTGGPTNLFATLRTTNAHLNIPGAISVLGNSQVTAGTGLSSAITLGSLTLSSNTLLAVGVDDSSTVSLSSVAPATGAAGTTLRLGSSGTTTVSGAVNGLTTMQVDRGNVSFSGAVNVTSTIVNAVSGTTTFNSSLTTTTLTNSTGSGNLAFLGNTAVTNAARLGTKGSVTLGNSATFVFTGGLTAGTLIVNGTVSTSSAGFLLTSLQSTGTATLTTGSNTAHAITVGAITGAATSLTAGRVTISGQPSSTGTLTVNSNGAVTFRTALNMTGDLIINGGTGTTTIPGGIAASVNASAANIRLTTSRFTLTGNSSFIATGAVSLASGSGIDSTGTVEIEAGTGGFSQAGNASIITSNDTADAISILVTGGNAAIGTLTAGTGSGKVTVSASGNVTDANDSSSTPALTNVRAAAFEVDGATVGSATNPIEYYTDSLTKPASNTWLVSTAPTSSSFQRFDFSRGAAEVQPGSTGVYPSTIFQPSTSLSYGFTAGQPISVVRGNVTSKDSFQFYRDSVVQTSKVATFHIDTLSAADVTYHIRIYFGSSVYASNTIVTAPGQLTPLASSGPIAANTYASTIITRTTDASGTISLEFKRNPAVSSGYGAVVGLEIALNAADLPASDLPQMLAGVRFDEYGLTAETTSTLANSGRNGQLLTENLLLQAREQALAAWTKTGITPNQLLTLVNTPILISDLSANGQLGLARQNHIVLDDDAMGLGWFLGQPHQPVPSGTIDLVTVLTHEFGHRLGLEDLDTQQFPGHIMAAELQPGERRSVPPSATPKPLAPNHPPGASATPVVPERTAQTQPQNTPAPNVTLTQPAHPNTRNSTTKSTQIQRNLRSSAPTTTAQISPLPPQGNSDDSQPLELLDQLFADTVSAFQFLYQ
ncbi:MAG: hypothetical protein RL215_2438, partial [Planctomycetota bacterium]